MPKDISPLTQLCDGYPISVTSVTHADNLFGK